MNYGDTRVLAKHYEGMKKYLEHLIGRSEDYLLKFGMYGDWIAPESSSLLIINTGYFYYDAALLSKIAGLLGKNSDAKRFEELAGRIKEAFNKALFNSSEKSYGRGTSFSYLWPLFLGIVPDEYRREVTANFISHIIDTWDGHISTGIQGTKYIFSVLSDNGYADVAYKMATREGVSGLGVYGAERSDHSLGTMGIPDGNAHEFT